MSETSGLFSALKDFAGCSVGSSNGFMAPLRLGKPQLPILPSFTNTETVKMRWNILCIPFSIQYHLVNYSSYHKWCMETARGCGGKELLPHQGLLIPRGGGADPDFILGVIRDSIKISRNLSLYNILWAYSPLSDDTQPAPNLEFVKAFSKNIQSFRRILIEQILRRTWLIEIRNKPTKPFHLESIRAKQLFVNWIRDTVQKMTARVKAVGMESNLTLIHSRTRINIRRNYSGFYDRRCICMQFHTIQPLSFPDRTSLCRQSTLASFQSRLDLVDQGLQQIDEWLDTTKAGEWSASFSTMSLLNGCPRSWRRTGLVVLPDGKFWVLRLRWLVGELNEVIHCWTIFILTRREKRCDRELSSLQLNCTGEDSHYSKGFLGLTGGGVFYSWCS